MALSVIFGEYLAGSEVVTLELAKQNSNIEIDIYDNLLRQKLNAAIQEAENYTGIKLNPVSVEIRAERWSDLRRLPVAPMAITKIEYYNQDNQLQILEGESYEIIKELADPVPRIYFLNENLPEVYPRPYPIKITGSAGYPSGVPAAVREAILLIFSASELYREDMPVRMNRASRAKLRPYKIFVG